MAHRYLFFLISIVLLLSGCGSGRTDLLPSYKHVVVRAGSDKEVNEECIKMLKNCGFSSISVDQDFLTTRNDDSLATLLCKITASSGVFSNVVDVTLEDFLSGQIVFSGNGSAHGWNRYERSFAEVGNKIKRSYSGYSADDFKLRKLRGDVK
jgi:hypothetical protein